MGATTARSRTAALTLRRGRGLDKAGFVVLRLSSELVFTPTEAAVSRIVAALLTS